MDFTVKKNEICRLCCLTEEANNLKNIFMRSTEIKNLSLKIRNLTNLNVFENDGLPSQICCSCLENIMTMTKFRQKCIRSDRILRKILNIYDKKKIRPIKKRKLKRKYTKKKQNDKMLSVFQEKKIPHDSLERIVNDLLIAEENGNNMKDLYNFELSNESKASDLELQLKDADIKLEAYNKDVNNPLSDNGTEKMEFKCPKNMNILPSEDDINTKIIIGSNPKNINELKLVWNDSSSDIKLNNLIEVGFETEAIEKMDTLEDIAFKTKNIEERNTDKVKVINGNKSNDIEVNRLNIHSKSKTNKKKPLNANKKLVGSFDEIEKSNFKDVRYKSKKCFTTCHICGKLYENSKIKYHINIHNNIRPYLCGIDGCEKDFTSPFQMKSHQKLCHTDYYRFKCEICGKKLKQKTTYDIHKSYHGDPQIPCQICGKLLRNSRAIKKHMMSHTGERPYPCDLCNKSFANKYNLKVHLRSHTKEKPFVCSKCGETFGYNCLLKAHTERYHPE